MNFQNNLKIFSRIMLPVFQYTTLQYTTMSFRFLPRQISTFVPRSGYFLKDNYYDQVIDTLSRYDYSIEQQRTPIIFFQKAFKYIEENNYEAIQTKLAESLPNYKQNFWYTRYPSEFIVAGGKDCLPKPYRERTSHTICGYDEVLEDLLVTRIWFDKNNEQDQQGQINVLMERGNFIYKYLRAINESHRFEIPTN